MSLTFYSALAPTAASWRIGSFQQLPSVPLPIIAGPASSVAISGIGIGESDILERAAHGIEAMRKMASGESRQDKMPVIFSSPDSQVEIHLGNPFRLTTQLSERSAFRFSGDVSIYLSEIMTTPLLKYQLDLRVGAARVFRTGKVGSNRAMQNVLYMSAHFCDLKHFGLLRGSIYPELGVSREEFEEMGVGGFIESYLQYASRVHGWDGRKALEEAGITRSGFIALPPWQENPNLAFLWNTMDAIARDLEKELERRGRQL
ncbi:MAG TPA: hypothetical protein PKU96_02645 [bacterium]|nr:hypothetical protein [bacterium]HQC50553.1 hypothetical protein [bacterium]HQG13617.1 hypothetical protein [bacterium]HQH79908.1 hypothetical protein [bacterium]